MKWLSKITVFIFHPLFFPLYGILLFFWVTPLFFPDSYKYRVIFGILLTSVIIPIIIYAILHSTGWIKPLLKKQDYSVLAYGGIWFLYENRIFTEKSFESFSLLACYMLLGYGCMFLFLMWHRKISAQMMGLASLTITMICLSFVYKTNNTLLISLLVLLSGWVATTQVYLKKCSLTGVLLGWLCGWIPQFLIFYFSYIRN